MYWEWPLPRSSKLSDMDDGRKQALRQKQEDFRTGIIVDNIYPRLHKDAGGFLDDVELDRVTSKEGNVAQVDELFKILFIKTNEDFDCFCAIIEKVNPTRANKLREAAELGLHRSSSSPVSQGHSRMLPAARNQRTPVPHGAQAPVEGLEDQGTGQSRDLHAVVLRQIPLPQGSHSEPGLLSAAEGFEDFGTHTGQPAARKSSPVLESLGGLEDVDCGQEDTDGPPSGSSRPETNFQARTGEHIVKESIWDECKSAVLCIRPNGRLNEETGTAFIASSGKCILLSALHCFLEDEKGEEDEEISGVAVEEELARPRLASRKEKVKKSEIDLQLEDPAKLKRMIENDERLLRDRILRYTYWFCYKKVDQYVELKGSDFVAEHVRVECSVKRDIISFPVEMATIEAKLAELGQQLHPIPLDDVKGVSDPKGKGKRFWPGRSAQAYGFPKGKPLARSGGNIVEYIPSTSKKSERIAYQVRTEGGSSGGPVFVTFDDDKPVVVAIHAESGDRDKKCNYGTLLWPFLKQKYFEED